MLSIPDMALLGAAALLLFGPEQLPRVARKAGNVMREIQNTSQSFIREMERAADLQDAAAKPPYEPAAYDPVPYDAAAYPHAAYDDTPTAAMPLHEPPAPDPEPPAAAADAVGAVPLDTVGEKLAEPRPALDATEARTVAGEPGPVERPPAASHAAEAAPQGDHPAHL